MDVCSSFVDVLGKSVYVVSVLFIHVCVQCSVYWLASVCGLGTKWGSGRT